MKTCCSLMAAQGCSQRPVSLEEHGDLEWLWMFTELLSIIGFLLSWESKDKNNNHCHLSVLVCWYVGLSPCWTQSLEKILSNVYASSWSCGQSKCYFHLLSATHFGSTCPTSPYTYWSPPLLPLSFPSLFPLFSMPIHLSLGHFTLGFKQIRGCSKQMEQVIHTLNYLPGQLLAHAAIRSRHFASQRTISESMTRCQTPLLYCTCSKERYVKEV